MSMSAALSTALNNALSGLRVSQTGIGLVSGNVANAETPGYTRKSVSTVTASAGDAQNSVRVSEIKREIDVFVQRQLRLELAGGAYASTMADYTKRIDELFGAPGASTTIDSVYNRFEAAFDRLVASPDQTSARFEAVTAADELARSLRSLSDSVQTLRSEIEQRLDTGVDRINGLLGEVHALNGRLSAITPGSNAYANLLDQRDRAVDELTRMVDVTVSTADSKRIQLWTQSGAVLLGTAPAELTFDGFGDVQATNLYSRDPSERTIGTIGLVSSSGVQDLIANRTFRSGEMAALIELRDAVLVETQTRLDALAASLALAVSAREVTGTAVAAPPGQAIDLTMMQSGTPLRLTATDTVSSTTTDYAFLPQGAPYEARPGETVVRYTPGADLATIAAELTTALGPGLSFSANGLTLTATAGPSQTVDRLSATVTATNALNQGPALPLFRDGVSFYTGTPLGDKDQMIGLAARISVASDLLRDPSRLVQFSTSPPTVAADPTRPRFLAERIGEARFVDPRTGIGATGNPAKLSAGGLVREMIVRVGQQRDLSERLNQGQQVVVTSLETRLNEGSGVDIDAEMANLLVLQNAFAANARIVSAVREMFERLIEI